MKTYDPTKDPKKQPRLYAGKTEEKPPPAADLGRARDRRLSGAALEMLAQQSTSVLRELVLLYLREYLEVAQEALPNEIQRGAANSIVSHQIEMMEKMPAAVLADLFLRAKRAEVMAKPDDQMVKDLLEI